MINHVKLEIAIQLCAENIREIYKKLKLCETAEEKKYWKDQLEIAYNEKDRVFNGEIAIINKILNARGAK